MPIIDVRPLCVTKLAGALRDLLEFCLNLGDHGCALFDRNLVPKFLWEREAYCHNPFLAQASIGVIGVFDLQKKRSLVIKHSALDWLITFIERRFDCSSICQGPAFGDDIQPDCHTGSTISLFGSSGNVANACLWAALVTKFVVMVGGIVASDSDEPILFIVGVDSLRVPLESCPAPFENSAVPIKKGCAVVICNCFDWSTKAESFTVRDRRRIHKCIACYGPTSESIVQP